MAERNSLYRWILLIQFYRSIRIPLWLGLGVYSVCDAFSWKRSIHNTISHHHVWAFKGLLLFMKIGLARLFWLCHLSVAWFPAGDQNKIPWLGVAPEHYLSASYWSFFACRLLDRNMLVQAGLSCCLIFVFTLGGSLPLHFGLYPGGLCRLMLVFTLGISATS